MSRYRTRTCQGGVGIKGPPRPAAQVLRRGRPVHASKRIEHLVTLFVTYMRRMHARMVRAPARRGLPDAQ